MWLSAKIHINRKNLVFWYALLFVLAILCRWIYPDFLPSIIFIGLGSSIILTFFILKYGFFVLLKHFDQNSNQISIIDYFLPKNYKMNYRAIFVNDSCLYSKLYKNSFDWALFKEFKDLYQHAKINISNNHLILGGGGGAFGIQLAQLYNQSKFDIVEIDAEMIRVANTYFIPLFPNLPISFIHQDGYVYIKRNRILYDSIFVDVFNGADIPQKFLTQEFIANLSKSLNPDGILLVNFYDGNGGKINEALGYYRRYFKNFHLIIKHGIFTGVSCPKTGNKHINHIGTILN
jgi:hypothetical protein